MPTKANARSEQPVAKAAGSKRKATDEVAGSAANGPAATTTAATGGTPNPAGNRAQNARRSLNESLATVRQEEAEAEEGGAATVAEPSAKRQRRANDILMHMPYSDFALNMDLKSIQADVSTTETLMKIVVINTASLETDIDRVESTVDTIENKIDDVGEGLTQIKCDVDDTKADVTDIKEEVAELKTTVDEVKESMEALTEKVDEVMEVLLRLESKPLVAVHGHPWYPPMVYGAPMAYGLPPPPPLG